MRRPAKTIQSNELGPRETISAKLSRADRRRRARRAQARHRAAELQLHQESLESRVALSINSYTTQGGLDLYTGPYRGGNFDGAIVVASDHADDVFIQQVATVEDPARGGPTSQDLLVANNSSFLDYKVIDGADSTTNNLPNYRHLFVTNGTQREEGVADVLRPDFYYGGRDKNGQRPFTTRFLLSAEEVGWIMTPGGPAYVGAGGTISYTQADGVVTSWYWFASTDYGVIDRFGASGIQFVPTSTPGSFNFPNGPNWVMRPEYIQPVFGSWDSMFPGSSDDNQQAWLDVTWTDITDPYRPPSLVMNLSDGPPGPPPSIIRATPPDLDGDNDPLETFYPAQGFRTWQTSSDSVITSLDNPPNFSFATLQFALPGAFASTADGAMNERSLGVIPATLSGAAGAISITWSDGIAYSLGGFQPSGDLGRKVGFRSDTTGTLRFDTIQEGRYTDSMAFIVTGGMGVISVNGSVKSSGIITLTFRRWDEVLLSPGSPATFSFDTQRAIQGVPGPVTIAAVDRYTPSGVVKEPIRYATFTLDAQPNDVTFFAGQTITRQVSVDLLAPGSTVFVDSPISVADFANAAGVKKGSLDFRATNVVVRSAMTAPYRMMVGRSDNSSRDRLTILPPFDAYSDYDNPWQVAPDMVHLYKELAGFPVPRTSQLQAVVRNGAVVDLLPMPGFIGFGYDPDSPPVVTIAPPGGTGTQATAIAIVGSDGNVSGFRIVQRGSGYTTARPLVTVTSALPRAQSLVQVGSIDVAAGTVSSVEVLDPGYGYLAPPVIEIEPPPPGLGNVRATAQARLDNEGRVIAIEVVDPGRGYVSRPTVKLAAPTQFALTESLAIDARIEANDFELYVNDDFGTQETDRGTVRISANAATSTKPVSVSVASILFTPGADTQSLLLQFPAPTFLPPAGFNPVGSRISGLGFRGDVRVLSWDALTNTITVPAGTLSDSQPLPLSATIAVRADSLYLEAVTTDIFVDGQTNVEMQSFLLQSRAADRGLAPFVFTTVSRDTGVNMGTIEGGTVAITLGNDATTPLLGSTAYQQIELQTRIASLRVRAAASNADPAGPFPYDLTINDQGNSISVDALAASSRPITLTSAGSMTFTSAVTTDSDITIDARNSTGSPTAFSATTSPISTRYGKIVISADQVEVGNSLSVTAAAVQPGREDVFLQARQGDIVLQGAISAVNDVTLEQNNYRPVATSEAVAATTTNVVLFGLQDVDDYAVAEGDRVLVKDQTAGAQNGVYIASAGPWVRSRDADTGPEISRVSVLVKNGNENKDKVFQCTTTGITLNVTAINFSSGEDVGKIDGSRSRVRAERIVVRSEGEVSLRTDATTLTGQAGTSFAISELNDITIPLLSLSPPENKSAGLVKLEALGVDPGALGANQIALSANLLDVTNLVVSTPNGTCRVNANTGLDLLLGDALAIKTNGARATGMTAAGDVTVRSQSGNVIALDLPIAGGGARTVRVATAAPLPAGTTYQPGTPGSIPSKLSGVGQINGFGSVAGQPFWGRDDRLVPISLAAGDRVLVRNQAVARENGIYVVTKVGGGALSSQRWELSRAADSDTTAEMLPGTIVRVTDGTYYDQLFAVEYSAMPQTLVERTNANQIQLPETFPYYSRLRVGQLVTGAGIAPNSYISSIDALTGAVSLDVVNPGQVYTRQPLPGVDVSPLPGVADTVVLAPSFNGYRDLAIGQIVSGAGIASGAVITAIDATNRTIGVTPGSLPEVVGPVPVPAPAPGTAYVSTIPLAITLAELGKVRLGQRVHLFDATGKIVTVSTVKAVSLGSSSVTLSGVLPFNVTPVRALFMPVPTIQFSPPPATAVTWQAGSPDQLTLDPAFTNYDALSTGQLVVGAGIAAGAVIADIDRVAGTITVSPQSALPIDIEPVPVSRPTRTTFGLPAGFAQTGSIRIGQIVDLYDSGNVLIDSIPVGGVNSQTGTVGLTRAMQAGAVPVQVNFRAVSSVAFGVGGPGSVPVKWNSWVARNDTVGSPNVITLPNFVDFSGLTIGQSVFGLEIPQGTRIASLPNSIDAARRSITVAVDDLQTPVTWDPANPDVITLPLEFDRYQDLALGRLVTGPGINQPAAITAYDPLSRTVAITPGALPRALGPATIAGLSSADTLVVSLVGGFTAADLAGVHLGQRAVLRAASGTALGVFGVQAVDVTTGAVTLDSGLPAGGPVSIDFLPLGVHLPEIEGTEVPNDVQIEAGILPSTISVVQFGAGATALRPAKDTLMLPETFVNYGSLFVGQGVFGAGINPGAVITKIDTPNRLFYVTPNAIPPSHELLDVAVADSTASPWYPDGFDDWVELAPAFNEFNELHVGQRVEFYDVNNERLGVGVVTGVDGAYRTVGFNEGAIDGFAASVARISFLAPDSVRFSAVEGVGATYVTFALPEVGTSPITIKERVVTTNFGTDGLGKTSTFVVSTTGGTNSATGSLGKMVWAYEKNDTRTAEVDVPVLDVSPSPDGSAVLTLDPLFTGYTRLRTGALGVRGSSRMFTAQAAIASVDEGNSTVTLTPGSVTQLGIDNPSRITFATLPADSLNPDQELDFKFWAFSSGNIKLTQEMSDITRPIVIDGASVTTAGQQSPFSPAAGTFIPWPTTYKPAIIDGQRITRTRRDRLVTNADRISGLLITSRYDGSGRIVRSADGSRIARLSVGGFPRGDAIRIEGVTNVVIDTVRAGTTGANGSPPNARLPNLSSIHVTSALFPDGSIRRRADDNTILNSTVVGGLSAGITIDGGANRTYVVGTTVGIAKIDNQTGIFVNANNSRIGVNDIQPALPLQSATRLTAGSSAIPLNAVLFKQALVGLGVVADGLPTGTVIAGVDSAAGVAYLSNAASVSRAGTAVIGHLGERLLGGTDESPVFNVMRLGASVPLGDVFVGQGIAGDGLPVGTVIVDIDRAERLVTVSNDFTFLGTSVVSFGTPGRNFVEYNRAGIVLRGSNNVVTNTRVANNTFDGIDVAASGVGNKIGSQASFGATDAVGGIALASWGTTIPLVRGAQALTLPATFKGGNSIAVGTRVYGPGIAAGTVITSVAPPTTRVKTWSIGLSIAVQASRSQAAVSFGVAGADGQPLRLNLSVQTVARLFVGQGLHGYGMPEFCTVEAISVVDGRSGYLQVSSPSATNLGAQNFASVPTDVVFSSLSATSNEIWGNGNFGIRIRPSYAYRSPEIARNYFGFTNSGLNAPVVNRLGDVYFAQYAAVAGEPRMPREQRPNSTERVDGFGNKYPGSSFTPDAPPVGGGGGVGSPNWPPARPPRV
jgi:hypothetical protein